jgi:hypothetical protein
MDYIDNGTYDFGLLSGKIIGFPKYLLSAKNQQSSDMKFDNINVSQLNFNKLYHNRPPTLYEDLIIFGTSGFYLLINVIQIIGFMFIIWTILFFFKEYTVIVKEQGNWFIYFFISLLLIYIVTFAIILTINLKWYTIISSVSYR